MKNSAADDRVTNALQNKVRGLVSAYKSNRFVIDRRDSPLRDLRIGIRHLFLDARAELNPTQYYPFIQWVNNQLSKQAIDYFRTSGGYDDLAGVYDKSPTASLERELLWITTRITSLKVRLIAFLKLKEIVEAATLAREYEDAIEVVSKIEKFFGCSMWSIQIRIALEHQAGGLERQKHYVSEVRSVYRTGLLGFVAYHTSVRNEDKTTITKFVDDIRNRIDRHSRYDGAIKSYLKSILAQDWPSSEDKLAEVLMVAQSHSIIDFYESFVGAVHSLVRNGIHTGIRLTLVRCLSELSPQLEDVRFTKALLHLSEGKSGTTFPPRDSRLSDLVFSKEPEKAARLFGRDGSRFISADPWWWIYIGFAQAAARTSSIRPLKQPADVPKLIGRVLNQKLQQEDSLAQLMKILSNFSGLKLMAGLADFVPIIRVRDLDEALNPHFIGLNSPTLGVEDVANHARNWPAVEHIFTSTTNTPTLNAWKHFLEPELESQLPRTAAEVILRAAGLLNARNHATTCTELQKLEDEETSDIHTLIVSLHLRALKNFGARSKLIDLVAYEGAKGPQSFSLLPIRELFENFAWEDFEGCSASLSGPIALHLWLNARDSDEALSWLRFATARFLKMSGCSVPSRLIDSPEPYLPHQLIYFMRNVCIPSVLDVSRVLKGSRKVLEERQAIFASLRVLDPTNSESYEAEISLIGNELALQEGQSIVDQSRIHVDAAALKRWAIKELSEDFERYLDLLLVDLRPTKDFDEIVKEILDGTLPRVAFTPENEADALLYSMLLRLAEEFLINPTFGFDFYLSKRVRHQSFIGLIRGPLEFSNLITTRESEGGKYRDNTYWRENFSELGTPATEAINDSLLRFGARFDEILLNAKNNLFHVRSTEKPAGLLGIDVTAHHVALMRSLLSPNENISDFVETAISMLWASLGSSLNSVRRHIADEIQVRIATYFDELKASVRKIAESDASFFSFDVEVGQSSADVQRALDDASRWFSRTSVEAQMRLFSLEQLVKVSIDSALKAQRSFSPNIETVVNGAMSMRASALVFVHDVFFVALDNVRSYSGVKEPWVKINVSLGPQNEELLIEIRSQTKGANRASDEKVLEEIRQTIANQAIGQRTRKEGRTGFIKIAAVVSQSSRGKIDFGYASDEEFFLHVVYSLVVTSERSNEDTD
jgi:hypothetical protein